MSQPDRIRPGAQPQTSDLGLGDLVVTCQPSQPES